MVEFMYTKEYNDGVEERGSEGVSESENVGVRTLNQGNGHTYKLVEFIQPQLKLQNRIFLRRHKSIVSV